VLWEDVTDAAIGSTGGWSNKVELADIDGDCDVDMLFADGGDYDGPGVPLVSQVWINDGTGSFDDHSRDVLGDVPSLARVIKVSDVNADGLADIFVGTTYQTQSRLYLGQGGLSFQEVTTGNLPQVPLSVGDAEFGDVDGDGDLDLALADWGTGSPMENAGGRVQLWLNDGTGTFADATEAQVPAALVRFSWELEFVDADNDWDLDMVVSCKQCTGSFFLVNDGRGTFEDASDQMPDFPNNYEFEVVDLNGDGLQDLLTINDGQGFGEHVFVGDPGGGFVDATEELWPIEANIGADDNMIVVLDYDSDHDPDFVIGSLDQADRLLINDGTGHLSLFDGTAFDGVRTIGTLGIATADLAGDGRLDMVQAQGEAANDDRVYRGSGLAPDNAPPIVGTPVALDGQLRVRIHDNKTPVAPHDFQTVTVSGPGGEVDLQSYGEALWAAPISATGEYTVCAVDRVGNETCASPLSIAG
jgi:FG-GAP-like repeat